MKDGEFSGKTVFVTGGGSGIGAEMARLLGQRGARVMVTDLNADAAETIAGQITAAGGIARAAGVDVTDPAAICTVMEATKAVFGGLDGAVNNAGIATPAIPVADLPIDEWNRQIAVNLTGVFLSMQAQLQVMLQQDRGGSIVNISSIVGLVGVQHRAGYAAAKHGVVGLTKTAALDHAGHGVRVNAVAPGYVDTPLLAGRTPSERAEIASRHPMNRMATPSEIAEAALFLLGDRAAFITGTVLSADGGYTAR